MPRAFPFSGSIMDVRGLVALLPWSEIKAARDCRGAFPDRADAMPAGFAGFEGGRPAAPANMG
jgi:hypothetical protein